MKEANKLLLIEFLLYSINILKQHNQSTERTILDIYNIYTCMKDT